MDNPNSLMANRIKAARMQRGLSQAAVARMLNLPRQAYNVYETGATYPRTERLEQLAEIFGVPISYFYEKEPDGSHIADSRDRMLICTYHALSDEKAKRLIDYMGLLLSAERDGVQL